MNPEEQDGRSDPTQDPPASPSKARSKEKLQQLGEARRRQGLSVRCVAQRLHKTIADVRAQEEETADLPISELYRWQRVLDVPMEELLTGPDETLSPRVLTRARLLRIMKTARSIRNQAHSEPQRRLARLLISQLLEIMPELKDVSGWPTVGHRRTTDEVGRIAENPISDNWIYEAT
jgi:hypothetical protein